MSRRKIDAIRNNGIMVFGLFLLLALLFVYFSGLFGAEALAVVSYFFDLPLRALVLLALADGISRLETPSERRFWTLTLAAFAAWFIADVAFQPDGNRTLALGLLEDGAFLLFYPLQLLAIEQRPSQYYWPIRFLGSRWLCAAAGLGLVLWSYFYFVGLPAIFFPDIFLAEAPSYFFYGTIDLLLSLILLRRAMTCSGRWRVINILLGTALLGWAACDFIDGLARTGVEVLPYGTPADVLWSLPYFGVVAAAVYRNRTADSPNPMPKPMAYGRSTLVFSTFAFAAAIPVIHLVVFLSGWLRELEIARELTVIVGLLALFAVGLTVQAREGRRRAMAREPRVVVLGDEEQQTQKMEALGRLAGGIAHDFNNLLMILQGNLDLNTDQLARLPDGENFLAQMQTVVDRGSDLSLQLLAFGRKQVTQPQVIDPRVVVADTESLLRRTLGEHIELVVDADPEVWSVAIDPGHLSQVLINLALNARQSMPNGGRLEIGMRNVVIEDGEADTDAAEAKRFVQFEVADNGRGMDKETRQRIFEPFFTTRSAPNGTGLGLAVIYGIVKQHGGYVTCESAEDAGSVFRIHLPRAVPVHTEAVSETEEPQQPVSGGSETILFAEDEQDLRSLTARYLRNVGYQVLEANDGEHALDLANSFNGPIHLVLTDVVMPRVGGPELAHRLLATRPDVAVLFVSGYAQDLPMMGEKGTVRDVLQKPYSMRQLAAEIRKVLDR